MKERFKKTLTQEILQTDMTGALQGRIQGRVYTGYAAAGALVLAGVFLGAMMGALAGTILFVGAVAVAVVLVCASAIGRKEKAQPVSREEIQLSRDRVTGKKRVFTHRGDHYEHYLIFENLGPVLTNLDDGQQGIHGSFPGYSTTEVGTSFFVASCLDPEDSKRQLAFYPTADWRLRDLTAEQIEEEIAQEEALIERLIACNRFPQPKMRQMHFQESPHAFWVPMEKTRQEQNVLDRFAVKYFNRDLVSALEFIELYCPWELQDAAQQQYSPAQYRLLELVEKYAETDKTRKKRQDRINEVKETLFRSDHYD